MDMIRIVPFYFAVCPGGEGAVLKIVGPKGLAGSNPVRGVNVWQCTLNGKRPVWKAGVTGNRDGGSNPLTVVCRSRSAGGAPAPKAGSLKGYVGSNPICGVYVRVAHSEERPSPKGKAAGSSPVTNTALPHSLIGRASDFGSDMCGFESRWGCLWRLR